MVGRYITKDQGMALDDKYLCVEIMEGGKYVIGKLRDMEKEKQRETERERERERRGGERASRGEKLIAELKPKNSYQARLQSIFTWGKLLI